jgi:hypothetical protein
MVAKASDSYYLIREWTGVETAVAVPRQGKSVRLGRAYFDPWNDKGEKYFSEEDMSKLRFQMHDYWVPFNPKWPCFDAYGRTRCVVKNANGDILEDYTGLIGFQMTIAKDHSVISGLIAKAEFNRFLNKVGHEDQNGRPWMMFVVPEGRFDEGQFKVTVGSEYCRLVKKVRIFVMQLCLGEEPRPEGRRTPVDPALNYDKHERDQSSDDKLGQVPRNDQTVAKKENAKKKRRGRRR